MVNKNTANVFYIPVSKEGTTKCVHLFNFKDKQNYET